MSASALRLLLTALLNVCLGVALGAETRVALVIGNGNYGSNGVMRGAATDVALVAGALRGLDFQVTELVDVNRAALLAGIRDFAARLDDADIALVYYTGYGVQNGGESYLIPVDARLQGPERLYFESVALTKDILTPMVRGNARVNLVFLDAARSEPYSRRWVLPKGVPRPVGLAAPDPLEGFAIGLSTVPGGPALPYKGAAASPYATALAAELAEPGQTLESLLQAVSLQVFEATDGVQVPWSALSPQEGSLVLHP